MTADRGPADLDGWFAGDVGHQEVHGDILTVDVLVHHVPDGHGHHVGVQVGVVLQAARGQSETHKYTHFSFPDKKNRSNPLVQWPLEWHPSTH